MNSGTTTTSTRADSPARSVSPAPSTMPSWLMVFLALAMGGCAEPRLTGNIRYLRNVHSTFITYDRDVIIYLPPDYFTNQTRTYPVLYMHDGQYLMDATTGEGQEWGVDETAQRLILAGRMEPVIIVGIYSAGYGTADRVLDYTPVSGSGHPTKPTKRPALGAAHPSAEWRASGGRFTRRRPRS